MSPRSKAQDAERKRLARQKQRQEKEQQLRLARARSDYDEEHREKIGREFARLIAIVERDDDPQRGVERVHRAIQWLAEAEKAAAADDVRALVRISMAIRCTLGSDEFSWGSGLQLRSWNGAGWLDLADIKKVLLGDLERKGLLQQFEEKNEHTQER